jgi:putative transposase
MPTETTIPWPHAPVHKLSEKGIYFVTAATHHHAHYFRGRERLEVLHRGLLKVCHAQGWRLEAWAIFSNHYHFVAESPDDPESLGPMLRDLHAKTAKWINKLDATPSRQVWHNYWDSHISLPRAYFARLAYTHQNPVRHGLVTHAKDYPWCSAAWFEEHTRPALVKSIYRFKSDSLADSYDVDTDWK